MTSAAWLYGPLLDALQIVIGVGILAAFALLIYLEVRK